MKNQVLSIDQMQKLKELGVDVRPDGVCFHYRFDGGNMHRLEFAPSYCSDDIKAFTLQDIIELLPDFIITNNRSYDFKLMKSYNRFYYESDGDILYDSLIDFSDSIISSAYNTLVWVAENGYLTSK